MLLDGYSYAKKGLAYPWEGLYLFEQYDLTSDLWTFMFLDGYIYAKKGHVYPQEETEVSIWTVLFYLWPLNFYIFRWLQLC